MTFVGRGFLDDHGSGSFQLLVPDKPSLVGSNVYVQSLITGRLSNRVHVQILP